jgi:hypothetical protein
LAREKSTVGKEEMADMTALSHEIETVREKNEILSEKVY